MSGSRQNGWLWTLPLLLLILCGWNAGRSTAARPRTPLRHPALGFAQVAAEPVDDSDPDWQPPRTDSAPQLPYPAHLHHAALHIGAPPSAPPARRIVRREKIPAAGIDSVPPY